MKLTLSLLMLVFTAHAIDVPTSSSPATTNFSLESYLSKLYKEDLTYKNNNLESKTTLLKSLLEQTKYNPNIFLEGALKAENTLATDKTRSGIAEASAIGSLHLNMRLYDAQRTSYKSERKKLFDDLSLLELLDAKEKIQLYGIQIYIELLQVKETLKLYNILLKYQKNVTSIASKRASKGLGGIYDKTQAQNDLINIELRLCDLKELLIQKEYIFRQSINLNSGKTINLEKINYEKISSSLANLQHYAMANNAQFNLKMKRYDIAKNDINTQESKKGLSVDWISHYGYGYLKRLNDNSRFEDDNHAQDWSAILSLKYPIYEGDNINLTVQETKIKALQAKNEAEIERRGLNRAINKLYNTLQKHKLKNQLYVKQIDVLKERSAITYNRYKEALESYKPYSDSLRDMARSEESYISNNILIGATTLQLYILTGKILFD